MTDLNKLVVFLIYTVDYVLRVVHAQLPLSPNCFVDNSNSIVLFSSFIVASTVHSKHKDI